MDRSKMIELTEEERDKAYKCYCVIKPYIEGNIPLSRIASESTFSYRTLSRWVKKYRTYGLPGLAIKHRVDSGKHRIVPEDLKLYIEGIALTKQQPSIAAIYRKVKESMVNANRHIPCYKTVYNIIKKSILL